MLSAAKHIIPPQWMTDYRSVKLMRVLGGYESVPQALYVGGCVRNSLLGKPVADIDVATIHPPLQVIERLKLAGVRYVPTGLDHGTVTALIDDATFEITTLRRDIDTNGRYAVIAFTTKWEEDAQRRDFTMNTLLADTDGGIYDPTGLGINDIDAARVVFVGEPGQRIAEDYLRVLRFFRFHAQYGKGQPDRAAVAACKAAAEKLSSLSRERITQEFYKIIDVENPSSILDLMFSNDVLSDMARGFKYSQMERVCELQTRYDAKETIARLMIISGMKPDYFENWLVLSNAQKKQIESYGLGLDILKSASKKKMRELVYRVGNSGALQIYFLYLAKKNQLPDIELVEIARYWQPPLFSINAETLMKAGVPQGPELGKKLKELEEKWVSKDFPANFTFKRGLLPDRRA